MSGLVYSFFAVALGWVRDAAAWLWDLVTHGASGFVSWVTSHWLLMVALICGIGMALDMLVYLLRWRPYRVWASFFRRIRGETSYPKVAQPGNDFPADTQVSDDWNSTEALLDVTAGQPALSGAYFASNLENASEPDPDDTPARRRIRQTAAKKNTYFRLPTLPGLTEEEESHLHIRRVAPARDKKEAFSEPFIPPQWTQPNAVGTGRKRRRRP